ncbi:L-serine ammonia-lyase, iron-sulfur-dependent subunit beta [Candidatus Peregrinibacteria bacterium]|nr:L-serine ammonia-lyase, iron-sulfur-dependent subunit beta [Candidatus Peregrinibacteria bacterium]
MPLSLFDVAGPIMVGPSSSHTAGACKIGQIARALFKGTPRKVKFYLYGSFATVYQGHATDKALLAGVMKMWTSDSNLKNSFEIAKKKGIEFHFMPITQHTEHHPNTVRIILEKGKHKLSVVGSSIGGGNIKITHINNVPIDLDAAAGRYFSLIIGHDNKPDVLLPLIKQLRAWHLPVSASQTFSVGGTHAISMLNTEGGSLKLPQVLELEKTPGIQFVRALTKLPK